MFNLVKCFLYDIRFMMVIYLYSTGDSSQIRARLLELKQAGRGEVLCPGFLSEYVHHESHVPIFLLRHFYFANKYFGKSCDRFVKCIFLTSINMTNSVLSLLTRIY